MDILFVSIPRCCLILDQLVTSCPSCAESLRQGSQSLFMCLSRYNYTSLTLNCIRYPALPLVHKGVPWNPLLRKPLSHRNFSIFFTLYIHTLINHISGKKYKIKIFVPFQNGGQITDFHFASFRFWPKFEKPLSQRNFSMKCGSN